MLKKEIGVSIYPDIIPLEESKARIDRAKELGYTKLFGGFQGTENKNYIELFAYAKEKNMELRVDITDEHMKNVGATSSNLKPYFDLGIPVVRVDCGVSLEEIVEMTTNPYGIIIEENLSNHRTLLTKMKAITKDGNINQYSACHNFYPRVNSGLDIDYAIKCAQIAKEYGCKTAAFIGSNYSTPDLHENGHSIMTVEKHRYIPSHIQAMELFSSEAFDCLLFGDSRPREDELVAVSKTTRSAYDCLTETDKKELDPELVEEYKNTYCIQIPVYFESFLGDVKNEITSLVMRNRIDVCDEAIRVMNWRGQRDFEVKNTLKRPKYSITLDNETIKPYRGEIEIILKDLPAVPYSNVIGMVKPCAYDLIELARSGKVMFQLVEE